MWSEPNSGDLRVGQGKDFLIKLHFVQHVLENVLKLNLDVDLTDQECGGLKAVVL